MGDYERGFRAAYRAAGDRKLEVVSGKAFSASQTAYLGTTGTSRPKHHQRSWSPEPPPRKGVRGPSSSSSAVACTSHNTGSSSTSSTTRAWCFNDPEVKRRKRVAGYKAYAVEGKIKASLRKSIRWIKDKCSDIVHGW